MKYVWLVLFLAAVFGLCFLADRCIGKVQARAQRRPAVRLPLRYPQENIVLHRDGISSGCRGIPFSSFFSL